MLDFDAVRQKKMTMNELLDGVDREDLVELTNEMIDTVLGKIENATDADVVFEPRDPQADDPFAASEDEKEIAWTLGHVIVHLTASSEESAFLAAEMARGVEPHGRSRSEVPWESVTTIEQCRQRLEESRRMCLATLDVWPDEPYLELTYQPWSTAPEINAVGRFALGLSHAASHLGQIDDVVGQAEKERV